MLEANKGACQLMTDAVETSALSEWAEIKNIVRNHENLVESFQVRDGGFEGSRVKKEWTMIHCAKIRNIVKRLLLGEVEARRDIAQQFVGKCNDWTYDAEGINVIVQCICFNEIVFG